MGQHHAKAPRQARAMCWSVLLKPEDKKKGDETGGHRTEFGLTMIGAAAATATTTTTTGRSKENKKKKYTKKKRRRNVSPTHAQYIVAAAAASRSCRGWALKGQRARTSKSVSRLASWKRSLRPCADPADPVVLPPTHHTHPKGKGDQPVPPSPCLKVHRHTVVVFTRRTFFSYSSGRS